MSAASTSAMPLDLLVVGGGIAGATCAARCAAAGLAVELVDRGRALGGRLATRTDRGTEPALPVDTGTAVFGAVHDDFEAACGEWVSAGVLRSLPDPNGPALFAAERGARTLVEHIAAVVPTRHGVAVEALDRDGRVPGRPSRAVVLAMPGPQAARLLHSLPDLSSAADQPYEPALTLATRWSTRTWPGFTVRTVAAGDELVRLTEQPATDGAVLLARSSADFAVQHLGDPQAAAAPMLQALRDLVAVRGEPVWSHVQRWTFARPLTRRQETHHLSRELVGLCGDGWSHYGGSPQGGVDAAWRSGRDMADALIAALA